MLILASSCLSVRPSAWNNSASTGRIFMEVYIWMLFWNPSRKLKFHLNQTGITVALPEDQYAFLSSLSLAHFFLELEIFQTNFVKNIKTHFMIIFFLNIDVYDIMWQNIVKLGRSQMTIWLIRIANWIPTSTNTHSEYVILIAFPLQLWSHERAWCCVIRTLPVLP